MKLTYLYGSRLGDWLRLLAENGFRVSPRRLPEVAAVTVMAATNSLLARRDDRVELGGVRVEAPVFVLGHWRSGTTHLQYLLAEDERLASPNTYEVCFPSSMLRSECGHGRLLGRLLPPTRLQDGMRFGIDVPNEDEIALAALGLPSPYLYWAFPEREGFYTRYLTFDEASPAERRRFAEGLDLYLRKLAWKHARTLLLKSPPHTARVALLRELYPDARFVHIRRDPFEVYRSTRHLHETWLRAFAFVQRVEPGDLERRIVEVYRRMYEAYFRDAPLVPAGQLHELAYEDLVRDPVGELRRLYRSLALGELPETRVRAYLGSLRGYSKNRYAPLEPETRERLAPAFRPCLERWGYPSAPA